MKEENLSEKRHYELSFWFSAQLDESAVEQKSNTLVRNIEEKGGIVTFNQLPQLKQLAYPIKKERSGYFGYLKFNLPAEKVKELKEKLDFDKDILRYLIITIPEEEEKEKELDESFAELERCIWKKDLMLDANATARKEMELTRISLK